MSGCPRWGGSPVLMSAAMAQLLKVGDSCDSSARRDLRGRRGVARVPAASGLSIFLVHEAI
jgi:hypothetical protein